MIFKRFHSLTCDKLEYKETLYCRSVSYSRDKTPKHFAVLNGSDSSVTE